MPLKKIVSWIFDIYLWPLKLNTRLGLYLKGRILTQEEHYLVALDVIRRKFPTHRGIVIDIGAFDGDSSIFLGARLKDNVVMAFEPNPTAFERGIKNLKPFRNIQLYPIGFSDYSGEVDFHMTKNLVSSSLFNIKDTSESTAEKIMKVKVDTLDNYFSKIPEILLIKLDVQGAELKILNAGKETLKKTKLVLTEMLVHEIYHGSCQYHEVDNFLRDNNFQIHTIITNYNNEGIKYFDVLYIKLEP